MESDSQALRRAAAEEFMSALEKLGIGLPPIEAEVPPSEGDAEAIEAAAKDIEQFIAAQSQPPASAEDLPAG